MTVTTVMEHINHCSHKRYPGDIPSLKWSTRRLASANGQAAKLPAQMTYCFPNKEASPNGPQNKPSLHPIRSSVKGASLDFIF